MDFKLSMLLATLSTVINVCLKKTKPNQKSKKQRPNKLVCCTEVTILSLPTIDSFSVFAFAHN